MQRPGIGHIIAIDVVSLLARTLDGFRYAILFTYVHTRYNTVPLLLRKSEAEDAVLAAITAISRHVGTTPARLRVNNAIDLLTKKTLLFMPQRGITVSSTVAYTTKESSLAERRFLMIFRRARATLSATRIPFERYLC